jgi:putative transcription factor
MDWDEQTVIRKKTVSAKEAKSTAAVNRAMATGNYEITKKSTRRIFVSIDPQQPISSCGGEQACHDGREHGQGRRGHRALQRYWDRMHRLGIFIVLVATVNTSVSKAIIAARQAKGMTQKDLSAKICEKPQIVQEYESGKAIPSQLVLGKLEKALGVKLRGSGIGTPLETRKPAAAGGK